MAIHTETQRRTIPAYVINLERDASRRAFMQQQLTAIGIHAEIVTAVDGRNLQQADRATYNRRKALCVYGAEMLDSEIACYLSHFRLYEKMVHEDIPFALIMEDDIEISPSLPHILQTLITFPHEWHIIRLETLRDRVKNPSKKKFEGTKIFDLGSAGLYELETHVLGFGAYFISNAGALRMLEYGREIFMPIDQTADRFWENKIVPYIVRPIPVRQLPEFHSSIGLRTAARHQGQSLWIFLTRRKQRMYDSIKKRIFVSMARFWKK